MIPMNHRMFGVGRDLCGSSSPALLLKQGHLQQAAQGPCPGGSWISPEKETPQPPWAACSRAPSPSEGRSSSSCSDGKVHSVLFHRNKPISRFIWQCGQLHISLLVRGTWSFCVHCMNTLHASKAEHTLQSIGTGCWQMIKTRVTWVKHCFSLAIPGLLREHHVLGSAAKGSCPHPL